MPKVATTPLVDVKDNKSKQQHTKLNTTKNNRRCNQTLQLYIGLLHTLAKKIGGIDKP
jgi:hypothetical protein